MRFFIFLAVISMASCLSEEPTNNLDSGIDSIILTDSVFTGGIEGPAFNSNGDLFVVNYLEEGNIGVLPNGKDSFELFTKLPNGSIGNGIRFNKGGDMLIADYVNHNILTIEKGTKQVEIFVHSDSIMQPNDLTLHENGFGFASDPNWAESTGNLIRFSKGKIEIVEKDMGTTNGIELSPDGNFLYVNESVQTRIWRYKVGTNGALTEKTKFIQFEGFGMDGMRCDSKGNLFLARYGAGEVVKISPEGNIIRKYKLNGSKPTNVTFKQDADNEVYVTMQQNKWVELIKLP